MDSGKRRLDAAVSEKTGLSRTMAKDLIDGGFVSYQGKVLAKPGHKLEDINGLKVHLPDHIYVSRAGYKLEKALDYFKVNPSGRVCLDVGASTGGFTHCLLQRGAGRIYAVDTGTGQLDPAISSDNRVISFEKTNINDVPAFDPAPEIACVDVSFVSLTKVLNSVYRLTMDKGEALCLIKPQFEAGRAYISKKGIVKNPRIHLKVVMDLYDYAISIRYEPSGLTGSPIAGGGGNKEFLLWLKKGGGHPMDRLKFLGLAEKIILTDRG